MRCSLLSRCLVALVLAAAALACREPAGPPGFLLLVTVDTLRADQLGAYGNTPDATPSLDALAAESVLFERAYAPAPFTRPSVAALLTGREPGEIGMLSNRAQLPANVPTLAELFAEAGWATGAVVSNPVLAQHTGLGRGFAHYDDADPGRESAAERAATDTTNAAIAALDELRTQSRVGTFLWVHYQDPHGPYTPPVGYRERFLPRELQRDDATRVLAAGTGESGAGAIPRYQLLGRERSPAFYRAGYAGEALHADAEIGRLLEALRERGIYDDAVVAFAADHGEGLGENDYWFAHGENLSEELLHVPLLLRSPRRAPQRRTDVASLVDLSVTLAAEFGLQTPEAGHGRQLLAPGAEAAAAHAFVSTLAYVTPPRFGLLDREFRYVITKRDGRLHERLFAIGQPVNDVAAEHPVAFEQLRTLTRQRIRALQAAPDEVRAPTGETERERLRALGYVDED